MAANGPGHGTSQVAWAASPPTLGGAHMRSALLRRTLPVTAAALMAAFGLASAQAGVAGAAGPGGGQPLRTRITGAPIPGTSTTPAAAKAAPTGLPSKKDQIKVLTAVLAKMKKNYDQFSGYD